MFVFCFFKKLLYDLFFQKLLGYRYYSLPSKENENKNSNVLWCKLDRDVLGEIMSRLCAVDQASFHSVCKAFRAVHPINAPKSLPWFVTVDFKLSTPVLTVELYDPSSSTLGPSLVHRISLTMGELGIPISGRTRVITNYMNGWLFMTIREKAPKGRLVCIHFLVYSLLTKQLIQLPSYYSVHTQLYLLTSSTDPSSSDCIFLMSETMDVKDKFIFRTIRNGDKLWTVREFNRANFLDFPCCMPLSVYIEGIFYLVTVVGQLWSYNVINGEFKSINASICDEIYEDWARNQRNVELFMLNGELVLICYGSRIFESDYNSERLPDKPCMKRYDWSRNDWIPVRNLGDQTLFINQCMSGVAKVEKEARDDNEILSNTIYYFFNAGCIIYSFENGDLVQSMYHPRTRDGMITTCVPDSGKLIESKYNSRIRYEIVSNYWDDYKQFLWVDPPVMKVK